MDDGGKAREQLIAELAEARRRIAELEARQQAEEGQREALAEALQATQALRASEEKYRELVEDINDVLYSVDENGVVMYISPAVEMVTGYTAEEIVGRHFGAFIHEQDLPRVMEQFEQVLVGDLHPDEYRILTKSGAVQWVRTFSRPFSHEGRLGGVRGVLTDITERVRTEEALRESEAKFSKAFQSSPLAVLITRLSDGQFIEVNETVERFLGYRRDELIGRTSLDLGLVNPADRENAKRILQEHGSFSNSEARFYTKSGEERIGLFSGEVIEIGGEVCIIQVVSDITERKRVEMALQESEAELAAIYDNAPLIMLLLDRERRVRKINHTALEAADRAAADAIGLRGGEALRCIHALDDPKGCGFGAHCESCAVRNTVLDTFETGEPHYRVEAPVTLNKADGPLELWLLVSTTPLGVTGEEHVLVCMEDITERVRTEEVRQRAEEALRESVALLNESQAVAHVGSWELDLVANRLTWSDEVYRVFGVHPQESVATYEAFLDTVHPDDRAAVDAAYSDSLREGRDTYEIEHRIVRRDNGEVRVVHEKCKHVRDTSGRIVRSVGMVQDITERIRAEEVRQQAEEALRESEEKYRVLSRNSPSGIFISDAERFTYVNQRFCEITGFSEDDLLNMPDPVGSLFAPEEQERALAYAQSCFGGGPAPVRFEARGIRKDGEVVWLALAVSPIVLSGRRMVQGTVEDITERKRMEEALRESERNFATLAEHAPDMIVRFDTDLRHVYCNPAVERQLGVPVQSILGKTSLEIGDPREQAEFVDRSLRTVLEIGQDLEVEQSYPTPFGLKHFHTHIVPERDAQGEIESLLAITRDVTAARQAEEEIRDLARFPSENPSPVMRAAGEGTILYANRGSVPLLTAWECQVGQSLPDEWRDLAARALNSGQRQDVEAACDGYVFALTFAPVLDDGYVNIYGLDITERKQAEEMLARQALELERSNAELEQFAYIASHDLREPLRMISSYLELLGRRYGDRLDEKGRRFIAYAVDGAARMHQLINGLLAYSRAGSQGKRADPVDCEVVLGHVQADLKVAIEESGAEITHGPLPTVLADELQLRQVFQNLIGNAVKFRGEEPPRVRVAAERGDGGWVFSVCDNGIGIDPKHAERIFLIFQRLHTQQEYQGIGMGLATCKKIVERHGGRIWVESEPGRGSTFYFTLPDGGNAS